MFRPLATPASNVRACALARAAATLVTAAALAGCGGGGGGPAPQEIRVRVLHLASDAPRVNVLVDGLVIRSALDYKVGTGFLSVTAERTYDFAVDAVLPTGTTRIIDLQDRQLNAATEYTVVAVGTTNVGDAFPVEAVEFNNAIAAVPASQFRVRLLHAAPGTGSVDIFLTAPDANLATTAPTDTLDYRQFSDQLLVDAGEYRIRITPAGTPGTLLFDSGTLNFAGGRDLLVSAAPNTGLGTAPISVVVDNGAGQPQIFDQSTPVEVRAWHLSPNTPPIQVIANPDDVGDPDIDLTAAFPAGLPYQAVTSYQVIPPDRYTLRAIEAGVLPEVQAFSFSQVFVTGSRISVLLAGRKAEGTTPSTQAPVTLFDSVRRINQVGQLRFVNASPAASPVDVYVLAPNTSITGQFPVARGIALGQSTAYLQLVPGNYEVKVALANTTTEAAGESFSLANGQATTVVSYNTSADATVTTVDLIVEEDLAPL